MMVGIFITESGCGLSRLVSGNCWYCFVHVGVLLGGVCVCVSYMIIVNT